jgi:hypothetical protein
MPRRKLTDEKRARLFCVMREIAALDRGEYERLLKEMQRLGRRRAA